ncbi:hypothetical protein EW026_g3094 [Hermanssonia centrifuga]|uniref:Knr4/Smi1-like domain-containing protein n=1 Tax=Hermanssonia centrifuga TaxID=98765 RepID=A0A4S4KL87_9APHY|nr:hypothetical protein EW026_g3094 [Hermanssonia centrifuga]
MSFGFALPQAIRDSYLCADGQEAESAAGCSEGLFFGLTLLPLEDVLEEYRFWREVDDDPNTGANARLRDLMDSIPPDWVKREYSSRGWIPLVADKAGNYLGVDVNPGEAGTVGQVIVFGRDFDTKVVMWRGDGTHGWAKWLSGFVDDLEAGEGYELGLSNDASEGSEDSVGYESYFYDGIGRGQGDGGGDTGTGGMRLSGEYRGWSVLEAWADRSVRKWQQMGVIPEPQVTPTKGKNVEQLPIETLKAVSNVTSSAEVPIPVLPGSSSSGVPKHDSISSRQPIPTISVTKPPVPMPVDLPTHDDIIVELETANAPPSHTDLESGSNVMMREIEQALPAARTPTSSSQEKSNSVASSKLPPPPSPLPSPSRTVATPPAPVPLSAQTPDLLVDSTTTLAATIPPLTTTSEPSSSVHSEDSPVLISNEDAIPPSVGTPSALGEETLSNDGVLVSDPEADSADDLPSSPKAKKRKSEESKRADSVGSSKEVA